MTVYVDNMRRLAQITGRPAKWSHLMADTTEELMEFAIQRLGLKPEWIQKPGTHREHFDVTDEVRSLALRLGAQRILYPRDTANLLVEKRAKFQRAAEVRVARATAALLKADADLRRDRWGYEISIDGLEIFARFVFDNLVSADGTPLTMAELSDAVICAMLVSVPKDMPVICKSSDEPADDDHVDKLIRIILDATGMKHPEPGERMEY